MTDGLRDPKGEGVATFFLAVLFGAAVSVWLTTTRDRERQIEASYLRAQLAIIETNLEAINR